MHEHVNEVEIAWAAGLFEGEGYMSAYQREYGAKIQACIGLGMADRDIVDRFQAIVECGAVSTRKPGTRGHRPIHDWRVYEAVHVRRLVALFLPYLGERRRARAVELLDQIADVKSHNEKKTHCPRGHELAGNNLRLEPIKRAGRVYHARRCITCRREQERARSLRAKLAHQGGVSHT